MKKEVKNLEEIKLFCEKHNLTLEQLVDGELIVCSLYLESLTTIPENTTFNVGGNLYLESLTTIHENTTFNVGGYLYLRSVTTIPENTTFNVGGNLYLESLTTIPENTTFNVGGNLYLESLTTIPENTTFNVGGNLYLESLTTIPENTTFNVGGYLDLESLTTIPENTTFNVGGYLDLESLTTIPENTTFNVGGSLYLESLTTIHENTTFNVCGSLDLESLTTIPENTTFNVGGYLDLRSVTTIPENTTFNVGGSLYSPTHLTAKNNGINDNFVFESKGIKYIYADCIMSEILEHKGNVYKIIIFGKTKESYLITDGKNFAHGETIQEAKEDLIYKITDRKVSDYNYLKLDTILTFEEAIKCYRTITGACSFGTKNFVTSILTDTKDSYSVQEMIDLTKNQFGNEKFVKFINNLI